MFVPKLCRTLTLRGKGIARRGLGQRVLSQGLRGFASFPSLIISRDSISAQGSFALQQQEFLQPDAEAARELGLELKRKKIGVVAHFYMDAELQGTLVEAKKEWDHIFCADSLAMGFAAVEMAKAGCEGIAVLGVDFMSESVKAYLKQNGFGDVPVFRMKEGHIGCSLAASAEAAEYEAYLRKGAKLENPLHVIYINTSLRTKADTHAIVPTITCTSSNVVQTILQAVAEQPTINILYGPDTYMGQNLDRFFRTLLEQSDEHIARIHPAHNRESIARLVSQFHWFRQGICVVHHMFGAEVTQKVAKEYPLSNKENFYTAHFEVPGEMFELAADASLQGRGVFGSTSGILNFITDETKKPFNGYSKKSFLLGTEAGMITSVVRGVQDVLKSKGTDCMDKVEIVFPVSAEAVAQTGEEHIPLVPGVQGGEGCSTAGGCATCPFMKMNDLDSLTDIVDDLPSSGLKQIPLSLASRLANVPAGGLTKNGNPITDGTKPIQYMRELMESGVYSSSLMDRVMGSEKSHAQDQLPTRPQSEFVHGSGSVG